VSAAGPPRRRAGRPALPEIPLGFLLLSVPVLTTGLAAFGTMLEPAWRDDRMHLAAERGGAGLVTAAALLALEALWLVRPWVFQACLAFVLSVCVVLVLIVGKIGDESIGGAVLLLLAASPALWYVRHRTRRLAVARGGGGTP